MSDMHLYGSAFYDFLKLRKEFFADGLGWAVPNDGIVEMDQYDIPLAHYSIVLDGDTVVAGARCIPTTTSWGIYSNMLKDSSLGILDGIPRDLFDPSLCKPDAWEGTRLVVADSVGSTLGRMQCLALVIDGLVRVIRAHGGKCFYTLSPLPLQRTAALVGLHAERVSRPYTSDNDGREYAVFRCAAERAIARMEQLGIDPVEHAVRREPLSRVS